MAEIQKFRDEILEWHNKFRFEHDSPNLKIDDELNKLAAEWAEDLATRDVFERRPNNSYGENQYVGSDANSQQVVESWYNEIDSYKFDEPSPDNLPEVGHFTQLVWGSTETMGCGMARSESNKVYIVCFYNPPGNIQGQFQENVRRAKNFAERPETNNTSRGSINKGSENEMPVDLVPSPSLEQLGIHPRMQPKPEVQLRMKQWLGVSSRKVGGWIKWLIDILGKALWWQAAIQKSLDVIMAIVNAIQFFTRQTKLEEAFDHGNKYFLQEGNGAGAGAKLPGREVPRWKRVVESSRSRRPNSNKSLRVSKRREMKSDNKISMRLVQRALFELPLNETPKGIIDKPQRRHLTNDTAEEKDYSEPRDVMETSKKITRPIGVTRPPEELRLRKENFLQVKNENDLSRKKKELEDVVKKLNKDIALYHSLCKRWKKINEQMTKEIIDREIFPPAESYEDEKILFYRSLNLDSLLQLRTPTFSEISLSPSDEFLEHKNDREVIVHKNSAKLYFNLQMDQGLPSRSQPGPN